MHLILLTLGCIGSQETYTMIGGADHVISSVQMKSFVRNVGLLLLCSVGGWEIRLRTN